MKQSLTVVHTAACVTNTKISVHVYCALVYVLNYLRDKQLEQKNKKVKRGTSKLIKQLNHDNF